MLFVAAVCAAVLLVITGPRPTAFRIVGSLLLCAFAALMFAVKSC